MTQLIDDGDFPEVIAPDLLGEIYGVRGWSSCGPTGQLGVWIPGKNTATCGLMAPNQPHRVPDLDCGCGLYAYYGQECFQRVGYGPLIALVKGWGRIAIARHGWRAQYAEIVAIAEPPPSSRFPISGTDVERIMAHYSIPSMQMGEIDELARNNTVPVDMRPGRAKGVIAPPVKPKVIPRTHDSDPAPLAATHHELWWGLSSLAAFITVLYGVAEPSSVAIFGGLSALTILGLLWARFIA